MGGRVPGVGGGMGGGCGVPPCARTALCRRPGAEPPLRAPRPPDEGGERGGPHRSAPPLFADTGLECPVCKEDYAVAEQVRQLPCNHFFHGGCIVPWLELVSASHGVPRPPGPPPGPPPPAARSAPAPPAARHVPGVQEEPQRRGLLAALPRPRAGRRLRRPKPGAVDVLTPRPLPPDGSGGGAPSDPRRLRERRLRSGTRNLRAPRAAPSPVTVRGGGRGWAPRAAPGWGRRGGR